MRKALTTTGILLMLVVFPAISWFYLSKGLDYRKDKYERLLPKTPWDSSQYLALENEIALQGKTTVYLTDKVNEDFVNRFYDQYQDAYTFQLVVANKHNLSGENLLTGSLSELLSPSAILIDTSMQVRNVYSHDTESLTQLIEDTAMTIPKRPAIDIILQNN